MNTRPFGTQKQNMTTNFRINTNQTSYEHSSDNNVTMATRAANNMIQSFFAPKMLTGVPFITFSANHITIQISYYSPISNVAPTTSSLIDLQTNLQEIFNFYGTSPSVEIRLIKLSQPYLDPTILATYLSKQLSHKPFNRVMYSLFSVASPVSTNVSRDIFTLPSWLAGIKVQLSGRLMTEKSRPRMTVQTNQLGSIKNNRQHRTDIGSYTAVNRKGSFTVKVWLCVINQPL